MAKGAKYFAKKRKLGLKKDNVVEDRVIKSLEKKLKLNKRSSKSLPKSFLCDGLDYVLDICDEETRKIAAESEKRLLVQSNDDFNSDDDSNKEQKKKKVKAKEKEGIKGKSSKYKSSMQSSCSESDFESKDNSDVEEVPIVKRSRIIKDKNQKISTKSFYQSDSEDKISDREQKSKKSKTTTKETKKKGNIKGKLANHSKFSMQTCSESDFESEDNTDDEEKPTIKRSKIEKGKNKKVNGKSINYQSDSADDVGGKEQNSSKKKSIAKDTKNSRIKSSKSSNKKVIAVKGKQESINDSSEGESNFDSFDDEIDKSIHSETDEKNDGIWEDIYGRKRDKDGNIVIEIKQKYIAPALRLKHLENNPEKSEQLLQLRRVMKGLLNRLAESNMHAIIAQLDDLYMSNSRNDMNEMISKLMLESIVAPVLTAERLVIEHMMCIAILHANVDTQVGAHFIMVLIKQFNEMMKQLQDVENKELDNLALMISHLYNFKVFGSQLIYQILEKLIQKFTEKEIEIILLILKAAGYRLRKDDPLALKELILSLQQKATTVKSSNSRIQFMLDVLLAIKNNNMNKIPQYDQSYVEHLKKVIKTLIRKGNTITQLNLSFEDLLNADERGKWWIVGSAWSGNAVPDTNSRKLADDKPKYSKKILELARAQRMNTDVRKNIFCVLMTAEDYLDAFEKLHHLGLKDRQEREIIYVILNCCLQEKRFNPYYAVLLQKFCEFDRKYQMTIQYSLWDKLKLLDNYDSKQIINIAKLMSYLFIQKALPLSILKVIQLGELDAATMKLFKKVMLDILLHQNAETCLQVFERIATSPKLHQFREGLRLFVNYFLLKNIKKDLLPEKQMRLLQKRIELVDKILTTSTSKVSF